MGGLPLSHSCISFSTPRTMLFLRLTPWLSGSFFSLSVVGEQAGMRIEYSKGERASKELIYAPS